MSVKIKSAKFIKGIIGTNPILKDSKSQIAFVGRSNVGKSTLINSILERKNLVKSSATPGKTRQINFFLVNDAVYFVDLPGYGYAKLSQKTSEKLRKLILWYFTSKEAMPKLVVLIIDAKVGPTELDFQMLDILKQEGYSVLVAANKIDKLKKTEIKAKIEKIKSNFYENLLPVSAKNKQNVDKLRQMIFDFVIHK